MIDRGVDTPDAELNGDVAGRGIHDRIGHEDGIDHPRSLGEEDARTMTLDVRGAESSPEDNPDAVPIRSIHGDSCVFQGQACRRHRHLGEAVHPPQILQRDEIPGGKTLHFRSQVRGKAGRVEGRDLRNTAVSPEKPLRKGRFSDAQRRDHADAGYRNPPIH